MSSASGDVSGRKRKELTVFLILADAAGLSVDEEARRFARGARVEAVHLTDGIVEMVDEISDRVVASRISDASKMLEGIAAGSFPVKTDPIGCARCPHFFICAAVPGSDLRLD